MGDFPPSISTTDPLSHNFNLLHDFVNIKQKDGYGPAIRKIGGGRRRATISTKVKFPIHTENLLFKKPAAYEGIG